MSIYNIFGVALLLKVSTVFRYQIYINRSVMIVNRAIIVYLIGIILSATTNYEWEKIDLLDILVHVIGFGIVIFGNLIYFGYFS